MTDSTKATHEPRADIGTCRGRHFWLGPIERAMKLHPRVKDCCMVQRGRFLEMYVVPDSWRSLDTARLRKHLQNNGIESRRLPDKIRLVEELPRLPSGKPDRVHLSKASMPGRIAPIPRIRKPLNFVQFEGVVHEVKERMGNAWIVVLAHQDVKKNQATRVPMRFKPSDMCHIRPGWHIAVTAAFSPRGLFVDRWERKDDKRTRIPLQDTQRVIEALV